MTLLLSEKQTLKCTVEPEDAYAKQHARGYAGQLSNLKATLPTSGSSND